jgi:hypothetical protein
MRAHLGRIIVYPIKSLDGAVVEQAGITPGGILEHDRVYAMVDAAGKYVNGKREPRVHRLRCRFDGEFREVLFSEEGSTRADRFVLAEPEPIGRWLSAFFGFPVALTREAKGGFPDDRAAPGPTVVGVASLQAVTAWFPALTIEGVRRRFRTNLELAGPGLPPFWEDRLFREAGELAPFQIGAVRLCGHNPCQRCAVPTRDPATGETTSGFQKEFMERRRQSLPAWANGARFNHFYRLAVNTSIPPSEAGKHVHEGDEIRVPEPAGVSG